MPQHAAAARSTAWFHPSVRDVRYRTGRTVSPVAPPVRRSAPPTQAAVGTAPRLSWLQRVERWLWRLEQKRVEDYLARSVDLADLEMRLRSLERRAPPDF
jgi:hypothetical protein